MAEWNRIGGTGRTASVGGTLGSVFGLGASSDGASLASIAGVEGVSANGPRGRRMLSADTAIDSLDRKVPRGTYLDLLV